MTRPAGENTPMVMRLRVALPGVKPAPWRRIEVLASTSLAGLHDVIQAAMGWEDLHLHRFRILGRRYDGEYADLTRVLLADLRLRAGERFTCISNHCAGWEHELRVEAVGPGQPRRAGRDQGGPAAAGACPAAAARGAAGRLRPAACEQGAGAAWDTSRGGELCRSSLP